VYEKLVNSLVKNMFRTSLKDDLKFQLLLK
jgi:hypothetical protein